MAGFTPDIQPTDMDSATVDSAAMGIDLIASWSGFLPMLILIVLIILVGAGVLVKLANIASG